MVEYLDEIKALYNTDKYSVIEITTNKNTYIAKLPYTTKKEEGKEDIFLYSLNAIDWCKLRHILVMDYESSYSKRIL